MKIDEIVNKTCQRLIETRGRDCVVVRAEICRLACEVFGANRASVIPSDYCYNRVNNGIGLSKPMVFEYLGSGCYRCIGERYPFNGLVYHRAAGESADYVVGRCVAGHRIIDVAMAEVSKKDKGVLVPR